MKRILTAGVLSTGVIAFSLAAPAADHREAPLITEDAAADLNDVYVFRSPADGTKTVLILTVNPFIVPRAQTASHFSNEVRYRFNVDNTGDAVPDLTIDLTFTPIVAGAQTFTAVFPGGVKVTGAATRPTIAATPNPPVIVEGAGGIKVFAGPTDDPFFFDFVGFNRFLAGGSFTKIDSFAGFNVSSIVVEVPTSMLQGSSAVLQIWAETDRQTQTVRHGVGDRIQQNNGPWRQIERTGVPAVSTVFIPAAKKDLFNLAAPKDDGTLFAADIVARLQALGTNATNIGILASVAVPDTLKFDPASASRFPNGRNLADDVIDTELFFIFNQPSDPSTASDGVPANDVPFRSTFPYLAPPHQPA